MRRYVQAQRLYFDACSPHQRTDILVDNQDPALLESSGMTNSSAADRALAELVEQLLTAPS
jgi:hypothetical protein